MKNILVAALALAMLGVGHVSAFAQNAAQNQATILQMQEQMRQLNGRVEELTFQILELQELLRQTRQDNETRFQDLEDAAGGSDAGLNLGNGDQGALKPKDVSPNPVINNGGGDVAAIEDPNGSTADAGKPKIKLGDPPNPLGTLTLDDKGKVVGTALGRPLDLTKLGDPASNLTDGANSATSSTASDNAGALNDVASNNAGNEKLLLPIDADENLPAPSDLYQRAYRSMLSGQYKLAEQDFTKLIEAYPSSDRVPNARYWLGESLFAQGDFNDAAENYLSVVKDYPKTDLAPDAMLKLGIALVGMGQKSVACSTFDELEIRYPQTPQLFKQRLSRERRSARCG